ncbi:MAG: aldehyde dehydrogenase family protein, partial [Deltaproteobacteria bacterium]
MNVIPHWIDGRAVSKTAERQGDVFNPATGEVSSRVALASPSDVDAAVLSARKAFETWGSASIAKRTKVLFAFRELVEKYRNDIARMLTLEHGKVLSDAGGEVQRGLEVIEFACGIADLMKGEFSENVSSEVD